MSKNSIEKTLIELRDVCDTRLNPIAFYTNLGTVQNLLDDLFPAIAKASVSNNDMKQKKEYIYKVSKELSEVCKKFIPLIEDYQLQLLEYDVDLSVIQNLSKWSDVKKYVNKKLKEEGYSREEREDAVQIVSDFADSVKSTQFNGYQLNDLRADIWTEILTPMESFKYKQAASDRAVADKRAEQGMHYAHERIWNVEEAAREFNKLFHEATGAGGIGKSANSKPIYSDDGLSFALMIPCVFVNLNYLAGNDRSWFAKTGQDAYIVATSTGNDYSVDVDFYYNTRATLIPIDASSQLAISQMTKTRLTGTNQSIIDNIVKIIDKNCRKQSSAMRIGFYKQLERALRSDLALSVTILTVLAMNNMRTPKVLKDVCGNRLDNDLIRSIELENIKQIMIANAGTQNDPLARIVADYTADKTDDEIEVVNREKYDLDNIINIPDSKVGDFNASMARIDRESSNFFKSDSAYSFIPSETEKKIDANIKKAQKMFIDDYKKHFNALLRHRKQLMALDASGSDKSLSGARAKAMRDMGEEVMDWFGRNRDVRNLIELIKRYGEDTPSNRKALQDKAESLRDEFAEYASQYNTYLAMVDPEARPMPVNGFFGSTRRSVDALIDKLSKFIDENGLGDRAASDNYKKDKQTGRWVRREDLVGPKGLYDKSKVKF